MRVSVGSGRRCRTVKSITSEWTCAIGSMYLARCRSPSARVSARSSHTCKIKACRSHLNQEVCRTFVIVHQNPHHTCIANHLIKDVAPCIANHLIKDVAPSSIPGDARGHHPVVR